MDHVSRISKKLLQHRFPLQKTHTIAISISSSNKHPLSPPPVPTIADSSHVFLELVYFLQNPNSPTASPGPRLVRSRARTARTHQPPRPLSGRSGGPLPPLLQERPSSDYKEPSSDYKEMDYNSRTCCCNSPTASSTSGSLVLPLFDGGSLPHLPCCSNTGTPGSLPHLPCSRTSCPPTTSSRSCNPPTSTPRPIVPSAPRRPPRHSPPTSRHPLPARRKHNPRLTNHIQTERHYEIGDVEPHRAQHATLEEAPNVAGSLFAFQNAHRDEGSAHELRVQERGEEFGQLL